jgi:hypothetical protein
MQEKKEKSEKWTRYWAAIAISLGLHVLVLSFLWFHPVRGANAQVNNYVEVGMVDLPTTVPAPQHSLETILEKRIESEVANLLSDASKSLSSDRISSRSAMDEMQMEAEIESDLRALEEEEFERLAAEKKDFGLDGVPDDGAKEVGNTYSEWDRQYDGQVTVAFDVPGRDALRLDVPGYRCLGGGKVVLQVEVTGDGQVRRAVLESISVSRTGSQAESVGDCLFEQAVKSARQSAFRASSEGVVSGTLTYRFVAQQ